MNCKLVLLISFFVGYRRKVEAIFENDERFNAIERERDREDLFDTYIGDIRKKV